MTAVRVEDAVVYIGHPPVDEKNDGEALGKIIYNALLATGLSPTGFKNNFRGGCYDGQLVKVHVSSSFCPRSSPWPLCLLSRVLFFRRSTQKSPFQLTKGILSWSFR